MQFKFKTIRQTRNALNAQQIYWEYVKLKKYFKLHTLTGQPKVPQVIFHRKQLPQLYRPFGMSEFVDSFQKPSRKFYYFGIASTCYVFAYYLAQLIFDDDLRYFAFIKYPVYMKWFEDNRLRIENDHRELLEKMDLLNKDLQGAVGFHNIKEGVKKLFHREKESLQLESVDMSVKEFQEFLEEQDKKIIK